MRDSGLDGASRSRDGHVLPWVELMAIGLGGLRLTPDAFWSLSIPELKAAIRGLQGGSGMADPLPRDVLTTLMMRFPDHPEYTSQADPERIPADGR